MTRAGLSCFGRILAILAVCGLVLAGSSTAGAADFPQKGKAIQMLVGFAAGGSTDVGARLLASGMEKELGTSVVVVNKPGASGQIAYTALDPGQTGRLYDREYQLPLFGRQLPGSGPQGDLHPQEFRAAGAARDRPGTLCGQGGQPLQDPQGRRRRRQGESQEGQDFDHGDPERRGLRHPPVPEDDRCAVCHGPFRPGRRLRHDRLPGGKDRRPLRECGGPAGAVQERRGAHPGDHG